MSTQLQMFSNVSVMLYACNLAVRMHAVLMSEIANTITVISSVYNLHIIEVLEHGIKALNEL